MDDFEDQLLQERLETASKEITDGHPCKQVDGTDYEWDPHRKAYFPKIDADFIAKYQMNYGGEPASSTENKGDDEDIEGKLKEENKKDFEQSCKEYYDYYYGQDSEDKGDNSKHEEYTYKDYLAYCSYYYGETTSEQEKTEEEGEEKVKEKEESKLKPGEKRKPNREEGWFDHDSEKTAHIYVSGLPFDITDDEYQEVMAKCGLIMFDPQTRKPKLKLYRDSDGSPKGDGLCCYIKQESVELALKILDGSEIRGHKMTVERAQFEMKGQYDPKKKRKKISNKAKRKLKENHEKLFDWRLDKVEEGRPKNEKTVVLKNMFDPKEFEENPVLINELREDVQLEAAKCGDVKKVEVYDRHEDGVMTVRFKEAEEADLCIVQLHGRWFAKRRIIACVWDGKTKYDVQETEEEKTARLNKWAKFLEKGPKDNITSVDPILAATDPAIKDPVPILDPNVTSSDSIVVSSNSVATSQTTTQVTSLDNDVNLSSQ